MTCFRRLRLQQVGGERGKHQPKSVLDAENTLRSPGVSRVMVLQLGALSSMRTGNHCGVPIRAAAEGNVRAEVGLGGPLTPPAVWGRGGKVLTVVAVSALQEGWGTDRSRSRGSGRRPVFAYLQYL